MAFGFGTKRSQVQILSPRPKTSLYRLVFLCVLNKNSGLFRTSPISRRNGLRRILSDYFGFWLGFQSLAGWRGNGQLWTVASGRNRQFSDRNSFIRNRFCQFIHVAFWQSADEQDMGRHTKADMSGRSRLLCETLKSIEGSHQKQIEGALGYNRWQVTKRCVLDLWVAT